LSAKPGQVKIEQLGWALSFHPSLDIIFTTKS
jgi:hypothetical protein